MREAPSLEDYLAAPVGAFAHGSHFLCGSVNAEVYVAFLALRKLFAGGRFPTIGQAARALGLGSRTLQRRLAVASTDFQTERDAARFEAGRALLMESGAKISAVAADLGFSAPQHFSDWFKKRSGLSPSEFRRQQR